MLTITNTWRAVGVTYNQSLVQCRLKCELNGNLRHAAAVVALLFLAASSEAAVRNVLLLQSAERGNLTLDAFNGAFRVEVGRHAGESIAFTEVVINPVGFDETPEQAVVEFLRSAYADRRAPDLIVTIGGPAAAFGRKYGRQIFPSAPLLYGSCDERFLQGNSFAEYETAAAVKNDFSSGIETILQVRPRTSTVFVIIGSSPLAKFWRAELERDFQRFRGRVRFLWSDDLSLAQILQRVSTLPEDSAIFHLTFSVDALGAAYPEDRVLDEITARANVPVFGTQSPSLGHGIVGGRFMPIEELGKATAKAAIRILNGESPRSVTVPTQTPGLPVFDARELRRWNIDERRLPPGSVVRFREPGVWERFKWFIVAALTIVIAQSLLVGALLINRLRRLRAEALLRRNVSDLEDARLALSNLSGRLMAAQEEERTRVSRELHDDVGQRLTFLTLDLAHLRDTLPAEAVEARQEITSLSEAVVALARDIQGISHRLHASKVESLGLSAAARGFCKELSSKQAFQVDYTDENVPATLPHGVALSLFRVLQEAVTNAVKHSGAQRCRVTLAGTDDSVRVEVVDDGRGFDRDTARRGLGLISMEERLKLVNGAVMIESRPGGGTAVRASVPLGSVDDVVNRA